MIDYQDFLQRKQIIETPVGLTYLPWPWPSWACWTCLP